MSRQEAPHLADRTGDRGAVDAEQQPQHRVGQVVPQVDQRGHQPVDEDKPVPDTSPRGPPPGATPHGMTPSLNAGLPWLRQFRNRVRQMVAGDTGEQLM